MRPAYCWISNAKSILRGNIGHTYKCKTYYSFLNKETIMISFKFGQEQERYNVWQVMSRRQRIDLSPQWELTSRRLLVSQIILLSSLLQAPYISRVSNVKSIPSGNINVYPLLPVGVACTLGMDH